jgi:hypothetical protein
MQASIPNVTGTAAVPAFETIRTIVLTPRGECVRRVYQLLAELRALPAEDREDLAELLALELTGHGLADTVMAVLTPGRYRVELQSAGAEQEAGGSSV